MDTQHTSADATSPELAAPQRWEQMALNIMVDEYGSGTADLAQVEDRATTTRRYYRRFEIVQKRALAGEVQHNGDRIACRKGCSYCCHNRVTLPAHEVLTLVDRVESMPEAQRAAVMERVARNAERVDWMDAETTFRTPMACAFLGDDQACSVYEDRPTNCRRYHSLALQDCESSFHQPDNLMSKIRLSTPLLVASAAHYLGFRKLLSEQGMDIEDYEMHTALREALADPAACAKRLANGEAAFLHARRYDEPALQTGS